MNMRALVKANVKKMLSYPTTPLIPWKPTIISLLQIPNNFPCSTKAENDLPPSPPAENNPPAHFIAANDKFHLSALSRQIVPSLFARR